MNQKYRLVWILAFYWLTSVGFAQEPTAQMPSHPTQQSCLAFNKAVTDEGREIYRQKSACMTGPAHISDGVECDQLKGTLRKTLSAWPQCDEFERQICVQWKKRNQVRECFKMVQNNQPDSEHNQKTIQDINTAEAAVNELVEKFNTASDAWTDPKRFIAETVAEKINKNLLPELTHQGEFTERGKTIAQETYDFIFNKSAGNRQLYSGNPVIAAIQGNAAQKLYNAHTATLLQLEGLSGEINNLTWKSERASRPANTSPEYDCSVLDTPEGIELGSRDPQQFKALVLRCYSN